MATITLYRVQITQAYAMDEQGEGYSLSPWGSDTDYYHGSDDGGAEYMLPDGVHRGEDQYGCPQLYDAQGRPVDIVAHSSGRPQLVLHSGRMPVLRRAVGVSV